MTIAGIIRGKNSNYDRGRIMLMKRGTVELALLFLGVAIIGFTLEVSVLAALAGENSQVGCYKYTPSTGQQRVDCIDPYRPFVILPPLLIATTAVAVVANRIANRRLAFRFPGIVLVVAGILFLILGIIGFQSSAIPCAITGCLSIFSSYYSPYWDEFYAGFAMTASGIGLLLVSRNIRIEGKVALLDEAGRK
jgi:hypothetical protein